MKQSDVIYEINSLNGEFCLASEVFNNICNPESGFGETRIDIPKTWGSGRCESIIVNPYTGIGFYDMKLINKTQLSVRNKGHLYRMLFCFGDTMEWEEAGSRANLRLDTGEGMIYQIDDITEICSYDQKFHYKWVITKISPEKFESSFYSMTISKKLFQHVYNNFKIGCFKLPTEGKLIIEQAARCPYKGSIKDLIQVIILLLVRQVIIKNWIGQIKKLLNTLF